MSWSKMVAVSIAVLFVFGFAFTDSAVAGEKRKWQGTSFTTETKKLGVGDVEGHVLLLTKSKQLYVAPDCVRSVGVSSNTMDGAF
jgi:hypothetical protein